MGGHNELQDDLLPLVTIVLTITAEMHKEEIKDEALKVKENIFAFCKKHFL